MSLIVHTWFVLALNLKRHDVFPKLYGNLTLNNNCCILKGKQMVVILSIDKLLITT